MTSIIPGPWLPPIWQQSVDELQATVADKEAEIQRLLPMYRLSVFMVEVLEEIASGRVLPTEGVRKAQRALRYIDTGFPEFRKMKEEGL